MAAVGRDVSWPMTIYLIAVALALFVGGILIATGHPLPGLIVLGLWAVDMAVLFPILSPRAPTQERASKTLEPPLSKRSSAFVQSATHGPALEYGLIRAYHGQPCTR